MQLKTIRSAKGETLKVTNEWAAEAEKRGTTVSSSTWSATGCGSVASPTLSGTTATVTLTVTGCGVLKNTVLLANGETLIACREVQV